MAKWRQTWWGDPTRLPDSGVICRTLLGIRDDGQMFMVNVYNYPDDSDAQMRSDADCARMTLDTFLTCTCGHGKRCGSELHEELTASWAKEPIQETQ